MSLEDDIQELTAALKENTAALRAAVEAADGGAPAKPAKADKPAAKPAKKAPPVEEEEPEEPAEEEEPEEPAEEEEAADEDLTAEVAAAAKKAIVKNKPAAIAVLKKLGASKVSEIEADDHAKAIKLFKAVK
jgi:hypothetical protein